MLKRQEVVSLTPLITSDLFIDSLFPIPGNYDLAKAASNLNFSTILDVGFGRGGASIFFAVNGKQVSAIGLETDSYAYPKELFRLLGISTAEVEFLNLPNTSNYDAIWMSHVLEHTLDVGAFLRKAWQLLADDGWLFVMVPPYKSAIVGGHVTTGWNLGQLMYGLLLCGFDIKSGHFIKHGYNLCAFVRKTNQKLPSLRYDIGDIEATAHLWPIAAAQGFNGDLQQVNWFANFIDTSQRREAELAANSTIQTLKEKISEEEKALKERSEQLLKLQSELVNGKKELELARQSRNEIDAKLREQIKLSEQRFHENRETLARLSDAQSKIKAHDSVNEAIKRFLHKLGALRTFNAEDTSKKIQTQEASDIPPELIDLFFEEVLSHLQNQDKRLHTLQELVKKLGG